MRHSNANRKFGREKGQRKALMKSLAHNMILKGKIQTTEAKAKELRPFVEKLVTMSRKQTSASKRLLVSRVGKMATTKLVGSLAETYKTREGGYTRITKLVRRDSDGAKMAVIEFV